MDEPFPFRRITNILVIDLKEKKEKKAEEDD